MTRDNDLKNAERPHTRSRPPTTPLWVKVSGACAILLFVLFVVLHLTGHGFGGHHDGHMGFMHHG